MVIEIFKGRISDNYRTTIAAKKANKPVILEEFGVMGLRTCKSAGINSLSSPCLNHLENKTEIYPKWVQTALDTDHS